MRFRGSRLVLAIIVAILAFPSAARGANGNGNGNGNGNKQFYPTVTSFEGDLYFTVSDERSKNTTRDKGLETSDTLFTEKIVLTSNGFVYHPRFLLFLAKLGGGLGQENFTSSAFESTTGDWRNFPVWEYEFRGLFLPEHPYNLELFALRQNPLVPGRVTWGIHPTNISEGALFTYKLQPVTFRLGYTLTTIESGTSTTDTDTLNANASYAIENFSLAGAFSRSNSRNSFDSVNSEFTNEKYSLQNQIRFFDKKFFLTSDVSQYSYDGENMSTSQSGDRFTWTEQLTMYLPWNFDGLLMYNHYKDTEKSNITFADNGSTFTSTTDSAAFSLTKRLYESLYAAYNFNYTSSKSWSGDYTDTTNSLNGVYTKKIPGGRFTAGGIVSRSLSDRHGAPAIINEEHSNVNIIDPQQNPFPLRHPDIDETSVRVTLIYPNRLPVDLVEGTNYVIIPGNPLSIQILTVPPDPLNPGPVYDFRVTYVFIAETTEIETSNLGYSLKLELFENLFNPYYVYNHRYQKVLSGTLPGGPEDTTMTTAGVLFQKLPFYLVLEHQDTQSNINPNRRNRAEATYRQGVTPTTNLHMRAFYAKVDYLEGGFNPPSPDETGAGGDISVQKRFPGRNLTLSAAGSYSQRKSLFETKTYTLDAALMWHVGKLDLSLGANLSSSETALDIGKQETMYQRVYLSIRRKLF